MADISLAGGWSFCMRGSLLSFKLGLKCRTPSASLLRAARFFSTLLFQYFFIHFNTFQYVQYSWDWIFSLISKYFLQIYLILVVIFMFHLVSFDLTKMFNTVGIEYFHLFPNIFSKFIISCCDIYVGFSLGFLWPYKDVSPHNKIASSMSRHIGDTLRKKTKIFFSEKVCIL